MRWVTRSTKRIRPCSCSEEFSVEQNLSGGGGSNAERDIEEGGMGD